MKISIKTLKNQLEAENIQNAIHNLKEKQSNAASGETTLLEAYTIYLDIRDLLLDSIEKGIFEEVPFPRRSAILNSVQQVHQYSSNAIQFINSVNTLDDQVNISRLWQRTAEDLNVTGQMKELLQLKRKMTKLNTELEEIVTLKDKTNKIFKKVENTAIQQQEIIERAKESSDHLETLQEKVKISHTRSSEYEQEIEDKKKSIIAFNNNIEKTQTKLNSIFQDIIMNINDEIEAKVLKAKGLIEEAETALELKNTEGISRAYGERLSKLNNDRTKIGWLVGACIFLILTLILGLMLTGFTIGNWSWGATDNEAVIFGRIAMTGIGITAAIFCAKRYLYLKNLEEDYEYKVVLTKSILAFAKKIKEINEGRVADYLDRVLIDLHQDPSRKKNNEKVIDNKILSKLEKLLSKS